ncbi:ABC transporter substrate-binding protein [Synechococcus sp. PCC 7336]|uniref:ABC transporter substrate-binding protein n=1 Tax=Synechococcus sp. PCC 7336 TaxID=195250 RepID=UPI0003467192|nr:ABC transporter substrate-binding protein [Synechococcus sp. PCC 7336]
MLNRWLQRAIAWQNHWRESLSVKLGRALLCCLAMGAIAACSANSAAIERPYLLLSDFGDPQTFNYYLSSDAPSRTVLGPTLSGLTRLDEDTLDWAPELAEGWEIFDGGLRIVFTLRPGLLWSDGEPLTIEDFRFTFEDIIFNEKIPTSSRDVLRSGESQALPEVRVVGDRQIEFTLPEPFAPFFGVVGTPVMPKHLLADSIAATDEAGNPEFNQLWSIDTPVDILPSSGPYRLTRYTPNQRVELEPNPHYYKRGEGGETLPKIPRLVRQIVASQDNQLLQFRSGSLDTFAVRGSDFQLLKQEEDSGKFTIYNLGQTLNNSFFCFNQSTGTNPETGEPIVDPIESAWFTDVNFRRAVSYAVNRQAWIDSVLRGLGQSQISPISPASPFHFSPAEGLPVYEYNPDRAKQLLLAAGYTYDGNDRLRDRSGNLVRFTLNTNVGNSDREAIGALIKHDLDQIGIEVDFVPIEFATLVNKLNATYDWEAVMLSFGGGGIEPNSGANIWRTTGQLHIWNPAGSPGREIRDRQIAAWEREIDDIFSAGTRELDFEKRKQLYNRFQAIVQEQLPLIGTVNPLALTAIRDRVIDADPRPILGNLWNLEHLDIIP